MLSLGDAIFTVPFQSCQTSKEEKTIFFAHIWRKSSMFKKEFFEKPINTMEKILPCVLMISPLEPKLWARQRGKRRWYYLISSGFALIPSLSCPFQRFHIAKSSVNLSSAADNSNHRSLRNSSKVLLNSLYRSLWHQVTVSAGWMFMGSGNQTLTHGIICISPSHFLSLEYLSASH